MVSDYGFVPDVKHIACMVDLLGHVGKVSDAEDFIMRSGLENNAVLWHALLRACRIHGDKNRGVKIGEKLMMLVTMTTGPGGGGVPPDEPMFTGAFLLQEPPCGALCLVSI